MDEHVGALVQLRAYLAQQDLPANTRLPAERELAEQLGVSRGDLRKALAVLEDEGHLWRHVGKGTFVGVKPEEEVLSFGDVESRTNPAEVMRTRLLVEPMIAREAALNATSADVAAMGRCIQSMRSADTWRQYEFFDNQLHRVIAESTQNRLLLALFDALNRVRRTVVWGRLRANPTRPPENHHSFAEHDRIVAAIAERDLDGAAQAMLAHLRTVERNLLETRVAAE
ncbi:FadR/GntR family transcriptional regulator [Lutibaculum baratangense]|uniref:Regulatory protein, GntR:Bacterial regulatory protein, GntR n=1 Tax=Lutibaculum baratangense AMV1 TaxID=631454 RepID=V4T9C8_9HYPH|nr:FadR/GntR family transcriptional regulator [Lutibaculum baratangense]ESR23133.1 regulatory protein, GntR:Bacterial regulatory protein, GntR [Lutibaculum baratangense AMV1]